MAERLMLRTPCRGSPALMHLERGGVGKASSCTHAAGEGRCGEGVQGLHSAPMCARLEASGSIQGRVRPGGTAVSKTGRKVACVPASASLAASKCQLGCQQVTARVPASASLTASKCQLGCQQVPA
eukprot:365527-Chlamydomonas_euryale.AAC.3